MSYLYTESDNKVLHLPHVPNTLKPRSPSPTFPSPEPHLRKSKPKETIESALHKLYLQDDRSDKFKPKLKQLIPTKHHVKVKPCNAAAALKTSLRADESLAFRAKILDAQAQNERKLYNQSPEPSDKQYKILYKKLIRQSAQDDGGELSRFL